MLDYVTFYLATALVVVFVAFLIIYAVSKPDTFRVQRTKEINEPPERIFPLIANLKSMNTWNPFVEPDPAIKVSYSGPESGKGAAHTRSRNSTVGEARIEITEVEPPVRVVMRLVTVEPMRADNVVEFTLAPNDRGTTVTCAMSGKQPFMARLMDVFIDYDHKVGSQFDKGLAKLKTIAEGSQA